MVLTYLPHRGEAWFSCPRCGDKWNVEDNGFEIHLEFYYTSESMCRCRYQCSKPEDFISAYDRGEDIDFDFKEEVLKNELSHSSYSVYVVRKDRTFHIDDIPFKYPTPTPKQTIEALLKLDIRDNGEYSAEAIKDMALITLQNLE